MSHNTENNWICKPNENKNCNKRFTTLQQKWIKLNEVTTQYSNTHHKLEWSRRASLQAVLQFNLNNVCDNRQAWCDTSETNTHTPGISSFSPAIWNSLHTSDYNLSMEQFKLHLKHFLFCVAYDIDFHFEWHMYSINYALLCTVRLNQCIARRFLSYPSTTTILAFNEMKRSTDWIQSIELEVITIIRHV